jgi:hypothetical protein
MRTHFARRSARYLAAAALSSAALSVTAPASALQLVFHFDPSFIPPFETPDGKVMMKFATAAAKRWEQVLPQAEVKHVDLSWTKFTDGTLGFTNVWNNISIDADLSDNICPARAATPKSPAVPSGPCPGTWFFDPTPDEDSEFNLRQVLFGQLPAPLQKAWFGGSPPSLLEVGYGGPALGSPANGGTDLLSVLVHEIGHVIGMDNWGQDYDLDPGFLGGVGGVSLIRGDGEGHLDGHDADGNDVPASQLVCMTPSSPQGFRWLPGAAVYAAVTTNIPGAPELILPRVDFLGNASFPGLQLWGNALGWEGGRVPGDTTETFVRGAAAVRGAGGVASTLNIGGSATVSTDDRQLLVVGVPQPIDGPAATTVDTGGTLELGPTAAGTLSTHTLAIQPFGVLTTNGGVGLAVDSTTIAANGVLVVRAVDGSPSKPAFQTERLDSVGEVSMGGGVLVTTGRLANAGLVQGNGVIAADGLVNNGLLRTLGGPLSLGPTVALDLDGDDEKGSAPGKVEVCNGDLSIDAVYTDDFDGRFDICPGNKADLGKDLWRLGAFGELAFASGSQDAVIDGNAAELHGLVTTRAQHAILQIQGVYADADATFEIFSGATLEMAGETTYCGSQISGAGTLRQTGEASFVCDTKMSLGAIELGGLGGTKTQVADGVSLALETGAMGANGGGYDGSLLLGEESQLTVSMHPQTSWSVAAGGLIVLGSGAVVGGSSLDNHGTLLGSSSAKGVFAVPLLDNQGTLAPGGLSGLGAFYAMENFQQGAAGTLDIDIAGLKSHDSLTANGLCTLDGHVEAHLLGGYVPQKGDTFDVVSCEQVVIAPSAKAHGSPLTGENVWQLQKAGNVVQLFVGPLP